METTLHVDNAGKHTALSNTGMYPPPLVFPSLTTPSGSKMQPEHVKQCVDDTDKHSALAIIGTSHTLFSLLHFHHSPRCENTGRPQKPQMQMRQQQCPSRVTVKTQ